MPPFLNVTILEDFESFFSYILTKTKYIYKKIINKRGLLCLYLEKKE